MDQTLNTRIARTSEIVLPDTLDQDTNGLYWPGSIAGPIQAVEAITQKDGKPRYSVHISHIEDIYDFQLRDPLLIEAEVKRFLDDIAGLGIQVFKNAKIILVAWKISRLYCSIPTSHTPVKLTELHTLRRLGTVRALPASIHFTLEPTFKKYQFDLDPEKIEKLADILRKHT